MNESKKDKPLSIIEFSQFTLETLELDPESKEGGVQKTLFRDINLSFQEKDLVALLGPSGSGKSLLCKLLAGITPALSPSLRFTAESKIQINCKETPIDIPLFEEAYPEEELRASIGFLFQQYSLFEDLNIEENIQIGRDQAEYFRNDPKRWKEWYERVIQKLNMDRFLNVPVAKLSGGQKQRVALARVLAARPKIIFYDEPTSGLDPHIATEVSQLIREVHDDPEFGVLLSIMITHDYEHLLPVANRVLLINVEQKIEETSDVKEIKTSLEKGAGSHMASIPKETVHVHQKNIVKYVFNNQVDAALKLPFQLFSHLRVNRRWHLKWFFKFLYELLLSAWLLILASGFLIGGLISFFSLTSAFSGKTEIIQPVLIEQIISSLGLILWTALSPLFAALFLALRSGASIVGYVGNLKTSGQMDAFSALGIKPGLIMFPGIFVAFVAGIPLMTFLHFAGASFSSLFVTLATQPNTTRFFWMEYYFRLIDPLPWSWVIIKGMVAGLGVALISYILGSRVSNATAANFAIQKTIFYSILYILLSFFLLLVLEQKIL